MVNVTTWSLSGHLCRHLEPWYRFLLTDCLTSDVICTMSSL